MSGLSGRATASSSTHAVHSAQTPTHSALPRRRPYRAVARRGYGVPPAWVRTLVAVLAWLGTASFPILRGTTVKRVIR